MSAHLLCIPHKMHTINPVYLARPTHFSRSCGVKNTQSAGRPQSAASLPAARILTWTITLDCLSHRVGRFYIMLAQNIVSRPQRGRDMSIVISRTRSIGHLHLSPYKHTHLHTSLLALSESRHFYNLVLCRDPTFCLSSERVAFVHRVGLCIIWCDIAVCASDPIPATSFAGKLIILWLSAFTDIFFE